MSENEFTEHLGKHWSDHKCVVCGSQKWTLSDRLFELREMKAASEANDDRDPTIFPVIPMSCTLCGNTYLLNAIISGAAGRKPSQEELTGEK